MALVCLMIIITVALFHDDSKSKNEYDEKSKDLNFLSFDELGWYDPNLFNSSLNDSYADPLCVPQDPLQELEKSNFWKDLDSILKNDSKLLDTNEKEKIKLEQCGKGKTQQKSQFFDDGSSSIQINEESLSKNQKKKKSSKKKPRSRRSIFGESLLRRAIDLSNLKKRCSHCETNHTPQWRAGPLGRNTLCNACGLRYKSGRLLAEYRPAASPTFDVNKHSNFHKKLMKRRDYNMIS